MIKEYIKWFFGVSYILILSRAWQIMFLLGLVFFINKEKARRVLYILKEELGELELLYDIVRDVENIRLHGLRYAYEQTK